MTFSVKLAYDTLTVALYLLALFHGLSTAGLKPCQISRLASLAWAGTPSPGRYLPKCREDGSFRRVQCERFTGFCWCVDENGKEIPRTYSKGQPLCEETG